MTAQDLIHGTAVSFQPELRGSTGEYGILDVAGAKPVMVYPGLSTSFGVDVDEPYEEVTYTPAHAQEHILELVRNVKLGEDLPFNLVSHPQLTGDWPLLQYITGSTSGLGDEPDSTSWLKELAGKFSLFTGIMFEDYKAELPARGVLKETISGFAGHRVAIADTTPATTEAEENASRALVWKDISAIRMDDSATPTETIENCVSDISFGFASEVNKQVHPESALTTKIAGVRVMSRKMFVSMKLTWVDQAFIDVVTGSDTQNLKLVIGPAGHATTFIFTGLYWPKYISKAEPKNLVGDTITCILDQPDFAYNTA
jgi:hypothetical protein